MPLMVSLVRLLLLALAGLLLGPGSAGPSFAQDYTVGPRDVVSDHGVGAGGSLQGLSG